MILTMCEGICSKDDRTVQCLWKNSGRALGGDFRSREIIEKYNLSVCRLSSQYVNLLIIYSFIYFDRDPPTIPPSRHITFFHAIEPTRGLSTVSAGMTANRASRLVFTLLVSSLLVSKHHPWAPAVREIPSMSTMDTSCDSPKSLACQTFVVGFSNVADEKIADPKHVTL